MLVRASQRDVGGDAAGGGGATGVAGAGTRDQLREGRDEPEGLALAGGGAQRLVAPLHRLLLRSPLQWQREVSWRLLFFIIIIVIIFYCGLYVSILSRSWFQDQLNDFVLLFFF